MYVKYVLWIGILGIPSCTSSSSSLTAKNSKAPRTVMLTKNHATNSIICGDDANEEEEHVSINTISPRHAFVPSRSTNSYKRNSIGSKPLDNAVSRKNSSLYDSRGGGKTPTTCLLQNLKVGMYFALWYILNIVYNIVNKKVLNVLPAPVSVGSIQFGIGTLYASTLWITGLRAIPKLTAKGKEACWKVGIFHSSGQLFSMVSLGAGPVSFTHIVKALEPFFSALVSALVFGKWMKLQVYLTLIPVVCGVGYACMKELSFSWLAFWMAMFSNVSFALRAVVSKSAMVSYIGENMTSVNLFAVVTTAAFILSIPVAAITEKASFLSMWTAATTGENAKSTNELTKALIGSGLLHYLNNEFMYLALSNVHPVTLAVGNTMKRVFIILASVIVFHNPVSVQAAIGSAVGIGGVLLYSLTKQHYDKLEATGKS